MRSRTGTLKGTVVVSVVALAALVAAPTALSAQPTMERTSVDFTVEDDVDCDFPVLIRIVGADIAVTSTVQDDVHEFHAFAGGHATLTNRASGASITVNIAGPGHLTFGGDGSFSIIGTGTSIFFLEDTPGIEWVVGQWIFSIDARGNESFTVIGTTRDLCAELAA